MSLQEKYRTPIYLFYYEDMSILQIAQTIGSNESTVKTHLSRARAQLKGMLEGGMEDEE
jgi:RNA polymerase sigma-70 factor (ECF subfamily)